MEERIIGGHTAPLEIKLMIDTFFVAQQIDCSIIICIMDHHTETFGPTNIPLSFLSFYVSLLYNLHMYILVRTTVVFFNLIVDQIFTFLSIFASIYLNLMRKELY